LPVAVVTKFIYTIEVAKIGHEQTKKKGSPDPEIGCGSEHETLIESKQQIKVGKLSEYHCGRDGQWLRRRWH
jgi:hypothetical protein